MDRQLSRGIRGAGQILGAAASFAPLWLLEREGLHARNLSEACRVWVTPVLDDLDALHGVLLVPIKSFVNQHVEGLLLIEVGLAKDVGKFRLGKVWIKPC